MRHQYTKTYSKLIYTDKKYKYFSVEELKQVLFGLLLSLKKNIRSTKIVARYAFQLKNTILTL